MSARVTRPLYLAQSVRDLNKLVTSPSYGRRLMLLYRASDTLAQNVLDTNLELPVDEEKIYILCMRYINLINTIRIQVQDERFFSSRFASTLKKVEELKEEVLKSLSHRYAVNITPINPNEQTLTSVLNDTGVSEKPEKVNVIKDNDLFITSQQLYSLMTDDAYKVLVMDARPSVEFDQCCFKFQNTISIPEEIVHKGLSTNTLQQKLNPGTAAMFKTRHNFDFVVLTDLETNKISYHTTKLHDLRTILVDWDVEQRYQTLPLVLEGGVRGMVDNYPSLLTNPGLIFNQLFHQFDDFIEDDIDYPDILLEAPQQPSGFSTSSEDEQLDDMEFTSGDKEFPLTVVAQRLLTICEHQVQLEEKLLKYTKNRYDTKRKMLTGNITKMDARLELIDFNREISTAESNRIELEERRRLVRREFDERCKQADDVSYLDYIFKDITMSDKKRLMKYQKRKTVEMEESEFEKTLTSKPFDPMPEIKSKPPVNRVPVPDRSTKPQGSNTIELELTTLLQNYSNSGVTGLVNIKNTCYMNTLVQCLRFCPSIAYFFTMRSFPSLLPLTNSLSELMKKLWTENRVAIRPHNFYHEACKFTGHDYSTGDHEDIHEFFVNITDTMHKELSEPLETSGDCTSYLSDWHKAFKSKISFINRTFFYQLEVTTTCHKCNSRIVKYEYNNNVFLSMEYDNNRRINVQNEVDKAINPSGDVDSQKYCSHCELEMNTTHQVTYYPNVLVVNLMRYTYSIKDKCVLRLLNEAYFPMELLFGNVKYNLSAIACHSGNRDRGHYIACCYHPMTKTWIEYNDENCTVAKINEPAFRVRAYMLFYSLAPSHDGINRQFFQS